MTLAELDKLQADPETAIVCPEHGGKLGARSDHKLVCGVVVERKDGKIRYCGFEASH